jgi:hypothetical protein
MTFIEESLLINKKMILKDKMIVFKFIVKIII